MDLRQAAHGAPMFLLSQWKGGIKVSCHTSCCIHWPPQRHSCINPRNVSRPYGSHQTRGEENLIRPIFVAGTPSDLWHCVCMCVRVVFYRSLTSDSSLSGCWLTIKLRLNISLYFLFFIFSFTAALSLFLSVWLLLSVSRSLSLSFKWQLREQQLGQAPHLGLF